MNRHAARAGVVGQADPGRDPHDFFRTEPYAVRALIAGCRWARLRLGGVMVDPACGDGAIMQVMAAEGLPMLGSDLVFRGAGVGGVDYLADDWREKAGLPRPDWIIANPPYRDGLPVRMLAKALDEARVGVAFLVRHAWLASVGERDKPCPRWVLLEDPRLALEVHVGRMSYQPPERDKGINGFADFVWLVFVQGRTRRGTIRLHHKRLGGG